MKAYIEHHQEEWGGGCSIFNNDTDFDPIGIGEWYYLAGKDKPNYPMPAPYKPFHSFGWIKSPTNGKFFEFVWQFETNRVVTYIE